jgi:rhodanese-related sulfurtransferase
MSTFDQFRKMFWWLPVGRVPDISATELHVRLAGDNLLQMVDVRSGAEWRRSHIPGAVSVPIHELKKRLAALQLNTQQPIIAICLSAHRSIPAVRLLQAQGFENTVQLKGGMLAWWNKHYPTERASGRWRCFKSKSARSTRRRLKR